MTDEREGDSITMFGSAGSAGSARTGIRRGVASPNAITKEQKVRMKSTTC